eukprot:1160617-Pelagomonas_calceolata.AAC.6
MISLTWNVLSTGWGTPLLEAACVAAVPALLLFTDWLLAEAFTTALHSCIISVPTSLELCLYVCARAFACMCVALHTCNKSVYTTYGV